MMQKLLVPEFMPKNMWRTRGRMNFPLGNLAVYLPLWHPELSGSPFLSKDLNARTCTVIGATHSPNVGRVFDGIDDVISLPNPSLNIANGFSVAGWFEVNDVLTTSKQIVGITAANDSGEFAIYTYEDDFYFYLERDIAATFREYIVTSVLTANTWIFAAATWVGGNISVSPIMYVNAVSKTITAGAASGADGATSNTTETLRLGLKSGDAGDLAGTIGDLWIYTRVLTAQEISHIYDRTKRRYA